VVADVQSTRRTSWRISPTRLRRDSAIASVAGRLTISGSCCSRQRSLVNLDAGGTVVGATGRRCFRAQSVDICVEVREVAGPHARTPHSEGAVDSDVRAADLQEKVTEQRFTVPSASTKTAATQRTSLRAERAIQHSRSLLGASGSRVDARRAAEYV
jgi:hypothetical protein